MRSLICDDLDVLDWLGRRIVQIAQYGQGSAQVGRRFFRFRWLNARVKAINFW